ncbi:hypothetical protein [Nocardia pseudovaccinii]|uniref:hypothetical protein n=1 Tax=Nocardia pseudovaccinii TaxID=189540 RepID=UPI000B1E104D|nr:hypothetical protein [Nocardia pseudovaccinii]
MQYLRPRHPDSRFEVGAEGVGQRSDYVRRERNQRDRRAYAVTITDAGRERLHEAEAAIPAYLDDTFAALTAASSRRCSANYWYPPGERPG